jgi:hypothetical protein
MKNPLKILFRWWRRLPDEEIIYLTRSELSTKSNKDLLDLLDSGQCSVGTGMLIVNILLKRLVEKNEN